MIIGAAEVRLHLPAARSLKDKRQIVKSILSRVRNQYDVSAAEVGSQDKWQLAELGLAYVSGDRPHANEVVSKAVDFIERGCGAQWNAEFLDYEFELLTF
ncbi:MAG: DUF503 domain-containing protein [Bacteroidota bacterium]